jgi:hypothetical protein
LIYFETDEWQIRQAGRHACATVCSGLCFLLSFAENEPVCLLLTDICMEIFVERLDGEDDAN